MRYIKPVLLSLGAIIAYGLIAILSNWKLDGEIPRIILLTVLIFIWSIATNPNRKFFS